MIAEVSSKGTLNGPRSLLQVVTWVGGVAVRWVRIAVAVARVGSVSASIVVLGRSDSGENGENSQENLQEIQLLFEISLVSLDLPHPLFILSTKRS